ncbi:M6 family metalloprotease domain-containing protein [Parahaliea maris]|uniref:M6 family metalloprotease domain-containing protein n=2 Tax=Parahaliea maris TaxID=2716870 RepID=A0A5C8ZTH9_9GAMM|nr:M6 family metalloprotease domain-containing protein [Parahaliea maris]
MIDKLADLQFDQLGHPQIKSDSIKPVLAGHERPHRLLILPVQFSDKGYDRYAGDPRQDGKNREYFQDLLFAGGVEQPRPGTLSHYYWHQSRGRYNITGDIVPVVHLEHPLSYYGRPVQNSDGSWRNDERATGLVIDALQAAYKADPDFPWQDYDLWDPTDFDGDGVRDEPDGYLDHFIMIVAGKGQASCQGLYKLDEKLNVTASNDAFDKLNPAEQACADRIWPHRFSLSHNLGKGPEVEGTTNPRGGIDIGNGLWVLDYNMQSEYTEVSTFIHEFGHSLGLPDIYARQTSNSTGSWEAMSATAGPEPQELSAWSRMVLGWLSPCVVRPAANGGTAQGSLFLKTMNDWSGTPGTADNAGACDAAMVILPPKQRNIELGPLAVGNGTQAAYSGQGNDMLRSLGRTFDLREAGSDEPVLLELDAWFEIEAEWDYLYVEAAAPGEEFERLLPTDKSEVADKQSVMPANKGHEGPGSRPGFTGLSGDADGDGKVESAPGCDPGAARVMAEDRIGQSADDPCSAAQWVHAQFDLSPWRGREVTLRFSYFTDGAAVENGALLDNITLAAIGFSENFESAAIEGWDNKGFTLSGGSHHLAVPHYYLLEYRDPYAEFAAVRNYDAALTKPGFSFFPLGGEGEEMGALNVNYRPGVVMWYYNGEYLWSQNEPAETGPGNGFLLVVDSTPREFALDAIPPQYFRQEDGWSWWEFDDAAQPFLKRGFVDTMCFQRRLDYYASDVPPADSEHCRDSLSDGLPPMEQLGWEGRSLIYGYTLINELLPGPERDARKSGSTLFDLRIRDGETQYRLYDRALRNLHSADAPFALEPFPNGVEIYQAEDGNMAVQTTRPHSAVSRFTDARPNRYLNPHLPFGGAAIPEAGFSYALEPVGDEAPDGTRVKVNYHWRKLPAGAQDH